MAIRLLIVLSLILICSTNNQVKAQNPNYPVGSRAVGIGDASATIADMWSIFNNPGGMAGVEHINAAASFENRYGLEGLNLMTAGITIPVKKAGNFGLGIYRFGDEIYNQQKVSLGHAIQLGIVSLGTRVSLLQYYVEGFEPRFVPTIDFGGIGRITPKLFFGAYVTNINQARISSNEDERVPTYLKTGFSYRPNKKIMINAEVEKEIEAPAFLKFGLEYFVIEQVPVRLGFNTDTYTAFFGLGFHYQRFQIDYMGYNHTSLGFSNGISVSYRFKK